MAILPVQGGKTDEHETSCFGSENGERVVSGRVQNDAPTIWLRVRIPTRGETPDASRERYSAVMLNSGHQLDLLAAALKLVTLLLTELLMNTLSFDDAFRECFQIEAAS